MKITTYDNRIFFRGTLGDNGIWLEDETFNKVLLGLYNYASQQDI